jgi:DNA-binding response OmpR family regulator
VARILVIDDEPDVRRLLRKLIEADGHEVIEAQDAREGYAALDKRPDAVLVDVSMPGEPGVQFVTKLRQPPSASQTPAMFVTAHGERAVPVQRLGIAGPHVIRKPFHREEIREALMAMLRSHRRRLDARVRVVREAVRADLDANGPDLVKNLSLGGLYVATALRRAEGDRVDLMIIYAGQHLRCTARVTHRGTDGLGLAYVKPDAAFLAAVSAAIDDMLSDGADGADRRREPRVKVEAAIAFGDAKGRTEARLKDLSGSGAFVVTPNPPATGSEIYLYLPGYTFSEGTRRRTEVRGCLALVVRHEPGGFGCKFIHASAEFRMAAEDLLVTEGREILVGM